MRRLALSALLGVLCAARLAAQTTEPRFIRPRAGASRPVVVVDPLRVPALQRTISLALVDTSRAEALRIIGAQSGLTIIDSSGLVTGGAIRLLRHSISVAAALATTLAGTNTDVVVAENGSFIIIPRVATVLEAVRTEGTRIERQIFDQAPNVGALSISGKELKSAPRFFSEADLLRTVQLLPGVEARNDYNAGMSVRGGEGDQNLVLLDGYPIYNPFHLGGLFGTFIEPTVGRVNMMTGAFPAAYGNRLSSVLDVRRPRSCAMGCTARPTCR